MFNDVITTFEIFPTFFYSTVVVFSLMIGSFLNVVIYRLPKMLEQGWYKECREFLADELTAKTPDESTEQSSISLVSSDNVLTTTDSELSLSKPASTCPQCGHNIRFYENVPILSWLFLRGKCSQCKNAISVRYPLVEATTAGLSLLIAMHYGVTMNTVFILILTWGLICLTLIDYDHMLLPDQITLPLLWLGLLININGLIVPLESAVIGAVVGYMSLFSVFWLFKLVTGKEGMGHGDFKLLALFGAWLGWQLLPLLILMASVVGAIVGISLILLKKTKREQAIPFGPYLAIAGWITLLWGEPIWSWYLSSLV
ncbi:MAG: leader peptidase (prepilin peptidase)/N-methyltransferase [Alteromonadaceae bacterium]|jgi:leader peptidase (prepilin peptidase)/N-methyltransferase